MFWFDKHNPLTLFVDKRSETLTAKDRGKTRVIEIKPDVIADFTNLPFENDRFKLIVFDPPHLTWAGETSWMALKYGRLQGEWKEMLKAGFSECFRVLDKDGVLIFKWSEVNIPLREILPLSPYQPLFGNRSGKHNNTHWLCFMKPRKDDEND